MKITIPGEVICKKNTLICARVGPHSRVMPGKRYREYAGNCIEHLHLEKKKWEGSYPAIVEFFFCRKTIRSFDLDNMVSSVLDILVKAKVIEDDSMQHVIPAIRDLGWEKDKDNPRVEIEIREYKEEKR